MNRLTFFTHAVLAAVTAFALAVLLAGCVSSASQDRVAQLQLDAVTTLAENYAQDLSALRSLAGAVLAIQSETRRADLESAIASVYLTPAGDADLDALSANLQAPADAAASDPLVTEVRAGSMTPGHARDWLNDYALAWRMRAGASVRAKLIAQLSPMADQQAARSALLAALDDHAQNVSRVFTDAVASSAALAQARALEHEFVEPAQGVFSSLWRQRILAHVHDPAARQLLTTALAGFTPNLLPESSSPKDTP